jgi:hypothetical protein
MRRVVFASFLLLPAISPAYAFELKTVQTQFAHSRYELELEAKVAAPLANVKAVLLDYTAYPSLDSRILEAKILERPEAGSALLYTKLRACLGWFCRNVNRTERVNQQGDSLVATVIPEKSDVSYGETRMELTADGDSTHIRYCTSISPDFWIPALIGRRLMLNTLRDATLDLFKHVEARAKAAATAAG